ncbi:MAG: tetratricopeptide repeat protein [Acidobacteriia bacterium]|nr:tetratricopeptide repeat protein [Terriglobia bacterium]
MLEFASVRAFWIIALIASSGLVAADTIYLKNGRTIVADKVTVNGPRVYYEVGEDAYAIPKSMVDRIESGGAPPPRSSSGAPVKPAEVPNIAASMVGSDAVALKIVKDGRVDTEALALIERAGNAEQTAAAYFIAGRHEYERGDRERARYYLDRALASAPRNDAILVSYAATLIQLGRPADAIPLAERATRAAPSSADAWMILGFAQYSADRLAQAIAAWKRSLALRPNDNVQKYLARAQRELAAESDFSQSETGHFSIHYEGATTSAGLRQQIQASLESDYNDLVRDLGISPRQNISVSLYTNQAFFDVTEAPAWIGAINDGKLRVPIQGLSSVTPELARVLKHETAHSFINQVSRGRCPQWLNEGIAQLVEPRSLGAIRGRRLADLYHGGRQIPLASLENSFLTFSPFEAVLAYDESLAAAEYIRDTYGMSELRSILERLGDGSSSETALRVTIHSGYADLEEQVARHLYLKYGK